MKKSLTKNYIYNMAYQLLVILLPIITTPYLSRTLGANEIGTYSYVLSITTYFIVFGSLGTAIYGQREIAFRQDNKSERSRIFFEVFLIRLSTLVIAMVLFYFIYARNGQYDFYYKIMLFEFIANILDISWFFQGIEEFKKTITKNLIVKMLSVISIFIFIKNPSDTYKYIVIYCFTTLFGNLSLWINLFKFVGKVKIKELKIFKHIIPTISLFIPQVAIQVYTVLDKTMIGNITNDMSQVGYYEQSQKIIKMLLTIITALGTVMMPRIAKNYQEEKFDVIREYMYKSFKFIFLLSIPMVLGIISVADNFVPLFFGEGYEEVAILMKIISPILVLISFGNIIGSQYLIGTKQQNKFTIAVVCGAVVNVIFNLILIKEMKAVGACIATVIAESTVTGIQFFLVRKEFKIITTLKSSLKYIFAGIVMLIISIVIDVIVVDNFKAIVTQCFIGFITYFIILLLLRETLVYEIIKKITAKIK